MIRIGPFWIAQCTFQSQAACLPRPYEQRKTALEDAVRLDEYVLRWQRWCLAGLESVFRVPMHFGKIRLSLLGPAQGEQL